MRLYDIAARSYKGLRQAKLRTILTSLAIGVGAFTIILSLAVGAGGRSYATKIISSNLNDKIVYITAKQENYDSSLPPIYSDDLSTNANGGQFVRLLDKDDVSKIQQIDGIKTVYPYLNMSSKYVTVDDLNKYMATIETSDDDILLDFVAGGVGKMSDGQIIITDSYRKAFGFSTPQAAIGQDVKIVMNKGGASLESKTFVFKIFGVVQQSNFATSFSDKLKVTKTDATAIYDFSQQDTSTYGKYSSVFALLSDGADSGMVKQDLEVAGYQAETAQDMMSFIYQFINVLQSILIGFGMLAILASVFGIINTQYISVLERTQQIGLMKALGMRSRDIGRLIKLEAAWIGLLGGVIGGGLAIICGCIFNPIISSRLDIGDVQLIIFEPLSVVGVIISLIIISVVSGLLPAKKAAKLNPIDALRTE